MTTPMTITDIERLLRSAAPDEPAVLPPLAFAATAASVRPGVRIRPRPMQPQGLRLVYAVVALLLLAAVVTVGGLRLLDQQRQQNQLAEACGGPGIPSPDAPDPCIGFDVPNGWVELGAGPLFPGDFTEAGIAYETVQLVVASAPLGACQSPGGPPPTAIPVGSNTFEFPRATPDPGLACLRSAALPDNGIRIVVMKGMRNSGLDRDGAGIADTSEPTADAGWTERVGGRPARLTITTSTEPLEPAETRTWDVLMPRSLEAIMRITADIAGPDVAAGRSEAQAFIDSITFALDTPPLDEKDANDVLRRVLDAADRGARTSHSDFYGCFPREPGTAEGTISGGPSSRVSGELAVSCSSAITPSAAGVWRIALAVTWPGTATYEGDTLRTELFSTGVATPGVFGGGPDFTGGQYTSDAGRQTPNEGVDGFLPTASYVLPPVLTEPLNLPGDAIVQMLYPAEDLASSPGNGPPPDSIYPGFVGVRLYVIDGPESIDGEDWYQVQSDYGGGLSIGWVRGTRDGRPQLEIVAPACPSGPVAADDIAWISAAERLACFGDTELTLDQAVLAPVDDGPSTWACIDGSGNVGPCPTGLGQPDWLTLPSTWTMYGEAGPNGPMPGISVWLQPSVALPNTGGPVRIRGHFDDPEATGCHWPADGSYGLEPQAPSIEQLVCRQRFVVTSVEPQ